MFLLPRDDRDDIPWYDRGNISAVPAPPGVTSNFVNPPSKAYWDVVTQAVCLTIATLLVAMRMYTKFNVLKSPGWDDCESRIVRVENSRLTIVQDTCFLAWVRLILSRV